MTERSIKSKCTAYTGEFMAALLLIQPLLDVLSYFMQEAGTTFLTTGLRMALLIVVSLYGFVVTDRKELYAAGYGLIAGFWLLHMLNCFRIGYAQPVGDAAEYLKLIQLPLWTMTFVSLFHRRKGMDLEVLGILAVNLGLILLVIGISYLVGMPVHTYNFPERNFHMGVLGWFGVPNAQSAILCLLVPAVLLWGLHTEHIWLFALCAVSGLGLMYFTGTRLTYYAAVLIAVIFLTVVVICRKPLWFCAPMLAVLVLLLAFRGMSPMVQRRSVAGDSFVVYQEKIDAVMGEDKEFQWKKGEEIPDAVLEKIRTVYRDIYGKRGVYKEILMEDMLDRYGLDRVMEAYDYTIDPVVLNDTRNRKVIAVQLVWEEQDFLTHLLGMEYASAMIGEHNYDPENDFPALLFYNGYLGTALYAAFLLGIALYALRAFVTRFPSLVTAEFITAAMMCAMALGAAQLSGQVLRKPNVTVYFSLALAQLIVQAEAAPGKSRLQPGYKRNTSVYLKKIS